MANGYHKASGLLADQEICQECGKIAYCESVDVGVGLYISGDYICKCGWNSAADGRMNVETYDDYFDLEVST